MKRNPYNLVFLISLVIGSLGLWVGLARAQFPDCPSAALVQVQSGFTLNVRALPGGVGQILGTVNYASGELRASEERNGFLQLETGGWIVNKYLSITCWELGTVTAVTRTPSFGGAPLSPTEPRPMATRTPQPTPTRIAAQIIYCVNQPDMTQIEPGLWRVTCKFR